MRNSKRLIPLFAFVIFCIAAYRLYHVLSAYDRAKIAQAIFAIPLGRLGLNGLCVAGSYLSLTFFDTLAIRYIGAKIPYRRIALASFTTLSIGHTLGLAAASSGAVRYRFYSRWGIGAGDIAKIILFCAMTAGLGLNTLMGLALLLQADVAGKLPGFSQAGAIALGATCLLLTVLYLAPRGRGAAVFDDQALAGLDAAARTCAAQIFIGATNFCFVAAVLYVLLPRTDGIGYLTVATAYVLANIAGIVSHVPGGLGVLEVVVVYLLPPASVIGALVVFRAIYFLVPFMIGAALFAGYELTPGRREK